MNRLLLITAILTVSLQLSAQEADSLLNYGLDDIDVAARRPGVMQVDGAINGIRITREELFRAACCNLGESFTTNPSVDVSYSDAATGAKQIRLLGLSGTYVQMLSENLPDFRGAATGFALDYVPGPWMQSIQVSKGTASVKNGYESITGQIDIEYLKPDDEEGVTVNLYGNSLDRFEANADGNIHLGDRLSTEILLHWQNDYGHHDGNDDGFMDQPDISGYNIQNRWKYRSDKYLFHGGLSYMSEDRNGGQTKHAANTAPLYRIGIGTTRYGAYMKHAFILNPERGTNIAFMGNYYRHKTDALYGNKTFQADQKSAYAQLLYESDLKPGHNLSAGLSLSHDYFSSSEKETVSGIYAQYTYNPDEKLTAMAGLRADYSTLYGAFVTPRLHIKYAPYEWVSMRFSAGKGYRTSHTLAENHNLLASARALVIQDPGQEEAWNYGMSGTFYITLFGNVLRLNTEYYRTDFINQAIVDFDTDASQIIIKPLDGSSYSNTFQVDATYPVAEGLEITAAYRFNDVRSTYGGILMEKPLTNRYKGLLSLSYKTPLELWQFDATLQLNGGGRLPQGRGDFRSYEQLSAQLTRWFRHFSIYIGGENLTGFRQDVPILGASDPWSDGFDATQIWGPVHGALAYLGIRLNFGNKL